MIDGIQDLLLTLTTFIYIRRISYPKISWLNDFVLIVDYHWQFLLN